MIVQVNFKYKSFVAQIPTEKFNLKDIKINNRIQFSRFLVMILNCYMGLSRYTVKVLY